MNAKLVEEIANAVLYEGYMLYPYRTSSVKNRQRWNFGVVYPKDYSDAQNGIDPCRTQTECLLIGSGVTKISIKVRFLQAIARTIGELDTPLSELPENPEPHFRTVPTLRIGEQLLQTWQEASEREVIVTSRCMSTLVAEPLTQSMALPARRESEPVRDPEGRIAGLIVRTQEAIAGKVQVAAVCVKEGIYKLTLTVANETCIGNLDQGSRDRALLQSLLSAHSILRVEHGEFGSLLDTTEELREFVPSCSNVGTWPVLVGEEGQRDAMLSSPIILYDYPQIAPESAGDLFDGTEIDEILALRILTLTEDEKREMREGDERARQILERTESLPAEQFAKLHGTLRGLRPASEGRQ
jgi:hydrogenase maturation protease